MLAEILVLDILDVVKAELYMTPRLSLVALIIFKILILTEEHWSTRRTFCTRHVVSNLLLDTMMQGKDARVIKTLGCVKYHFLTPMCGRIVFLPTEACLRGCVVEPRAVIRSLCCYH